MPSWTTARAIREALFAAMEADPSVVLMGEEPDGLYGATEGAAERFGDRVVRIAHDEGALLGAAIGMAYAGLRPVVELLLGDHLGGATAQLTGELASLRYVTGGEFTAPVVVRVPVGRGTGAGPRQSASPEAALAGVPGLVVVSPSGPQEAYGMLRAALTSADPVVICEPKTVYPQRGEVDPDLAVPLGRSAMVREGGDLTVVAWGAGVSAARVAAERVSEEDGIEASVLDLRTLAPLDADALTAAVAATGRAIVVGDGPRTAGFGAEVAATIAEGALEYLEAPVLRVSAADAPASVRGEAVSGALDVERLCEAMRGTACWV